MQKVNSVHRSLHDEVNRTWAPHLNMSQAKARTQSRVSHTKQIVRHPSQIVLDGEITIMILKVYLNTSSEVSPTAVKKV